MIILDTIWDAFCACSVRILYSNSTLTLSDICSSAFISVVVGRIVICCCLHCFTRNWLGIVRNCYQFIFSTCQFHVIFHIFTTVAFCWSKTRRFWWHMQMWSSYFSFSYKIVFNWNFFITALRKYWCIPALITNNRIKLWTKFKFLAAQWGQPNRPSCTQLTFSVWITIMSMLSG